MSTAERLNSRALCFGSIQGPRLACHKAYSSGNGLGAVEPGNIVIHGYTNRHKSTVLLIPFSHLQYTTYNDNMHSLQRAGQDGSGIRSHKGQTKPSIYFVAHK